jgi:hypothetical protein
VLLAREKRAGARCNPAIDEISHFVEEIVRFGAPFLDTGWTRTRFNGWQEKYRMTHLDELLPDIIGDNN